MFYENLEAILKERNSNINKFAKEIGIKQQTIANWKNRSVPSAEYIKKIAEHLNISADYLLEIEVQHNSGSLTAQEEQLIECFRSADDRGKELIISIAKQEAERMKEKEKSYNSKVV